MRTELRVMEQGAAVPDDPVDDELRRVARLLLPRSEIVAARVTEHVLEHVPELAPGGTATSVAVVRNSTEQNIGAMLATLAFGMPSHRVEAPVGTRDLVHQLLDGGGDVTDLLRAYRVGHELLWRVWAEHVESEVTTASAPGGGDRAATVSAVLLASSRHLFDFIDAACQRIVEEFPPSGRGARAAAAGPRDRSRRVAELLGSDPLDIATASAGLGYAIDRVHVAVVATPLAATAAVRAALQAVLDGTAAALTVPAGDGTWWGWLAWDRVPEDDVLARIAALTVTDVLVGMGEPGAGRDGFRRSHQQAREAERVARLGPRPAAGVTRYRDVDVASLLCVDPDRARRFAAERLGALSERTEAGARLRETLRAVLEHGHNRGEAARVLRVHHKTVTYRIQQAEALLGRPLTTGTGDLDAALRIDRTLHGP